MSEARAHAHVLIAPAPSREDLVRVLQDVGLDEPFDEAGDLAVMAYTADEAMEPVGCVVGRTVEVEGGAPLALFEHVLIRPAWDSTGLAVRLADAWQTLCEYRGFTQAICRIPKHLDRAEIPRLALAWGFRPYQEDDEAIWYAKPLRGVRPAEPGDRAGAPPHELPPERAPSGPETPDLASGDASRRLA